MPQVADVRARHVVIVIAQGLTAADVGGAALPNIRTMTRLGLYVERCEPGEDAGIAGLLLNPAGINAVAEAASTAGRRFVQFLPWKPASWVAERTRHPHWSVVDRRLDETTSSWQDLLQAEPRFIASDGSADDAEATAYFQERILARFPGTATMFHDQTDAVTAWMRWVSDAFMRAIWYTTSRQPEGVAAVVCHPAPRLCTALDPEGGPARGAQMIDDLVGRLLMLREHEDLRDAVVILCGDGETAGGPEDAPFVAIGPGVDEARVVAGVALDEAAGWLRQVVAGPTPTAHNLP